MEGKEQNLQDVIQKDEKLDYRAKEWERAQEDVFRKKYGNREDEEHGR